MAHNLSFLRIVMTWIILLENFLICHAGCPNLCTCKWKSGKQTAECIAQGLKVVPAGLNTGIQVINLSENNLQTIPSRVFQQKGLVNLQKIFLTNCDITTIASDAFFQLSNLVELDLSNNNISSLPVEALRYCSHLRRLQLAKNPIKTIKRNSLSSLTHLTFLDLSNCEIQSLQNESFKGLKSLEILRLDGNRLNTLSINALSSVTQLSGLHLHNNPWYCDCSIRDVRQWMIDQNIPLGIPPHCVNPYQVKGITWDLMSLEDFACLPKIIGSLSKEIKVITGQNASLVCQVNSTPTAFIFWEIGGRNLKNITSNLEYRAKYAIDSDTNMSRLTVTNVAETDNEVYTCFAENKAGSASMNFTVTVMLPNLTDGSWSGTQITILLVGIFLAIVLVATVFCILLMHPISLANGAKFSGVNLLNTLTIKKQDIVEMNDVLADKDEKDFIVSGNANEKTPRNETGSLGYGSNQLTPDLVSKIGGLNNETVVSTSTTNACHSSMNEAVSPNDFSLMMNNHWSVAKINSQKYEDSSGRNICSEIYSNPCYGKDDSDSYSTQSPTMNQDFHPERNVPINNRVQKLRSCFANSTSTSIADDFCLGSTSNGNWKRHQSAGNANYYTLPAKARFSPDEGYAEEALEGTEV